MQVLPIFRVDFNEMVELPNLVLLSATDSKVDLDGKLVHLYEGMRASLLMIDLDSNGIRDDLYAEGVVERNWARGWSSHVRWVCRVDAGGIRPKSELFD